MARILAGLALALLLAAPVSAGRQTYTIVLASSGAESTFTVTRTLADNDPVAWVHVECDVPTGGAYQPADETAVRWGLSTSLTGTATLATPGTTCTAWATVSPWRVKRSDPSVTFTP